MSWFLFYVDVFSSAVMLILLVFILYMECRATRRREERDREREREFRLRMDAILAQIDTSIATIKGTAGS